jgi:hypothetical protein
MLAIYNRAEANNCQSKRMLRWKTLYICKQTECGREGMYVVI